MGNTNTRTKIQAGTENMFYGLLIKILPTHRRTCICVCSPLHEKKTSRKGFVLKLSEACCEENKIIAGIIT